MAFFVISVVLNLFTPELFGSVQCSDVFGARSLLSLQAVEGDIEAVKNSWRERMIEKEPGTSFVESFFIGTDRAVRLQTTNGFMNAGIFYLEKSGSILKLYQASGFPYAEFVDTVRSNLMAMYVGGPSVFSFGELKSRELIETVSRGQEKKIGGRVFFIEFENIAVPQSFTLKDARILKKTIPDGALESIAELTLRAVKQKLVPDDEDFMIAPNGSARWIDGDSWYRLEQSSTFQYIQQLIFKLALLPKSFDEVFLLKLQESKLFSESEKAEIHKAWTKSPP